MTCYSTYLRRLVVFFIIFGVIFFSGAHLVYAAISCPQGMSQLDCNALRGGWADWVPDDSCSTDTTTPVATPSPTNGSYTYVKAGNIPKKGKQITATYFGGSYHSGSWYIDNQDQINKIKSGQKKLSDYHARLGNASDDNGLGGPGQGASDGKTVWAEIANGTSFGGLPYGTKLAITYKGKTIVAEKNQNGGGAPGASLDLWWETARLLDFKNGKDTMTVHAVSNDTPVTPVNGSQPNPNNTVPQTGSCACSTTDSSLIGNTNAERAFNFFVSNAGLSAEQSAAIIGNMMQESGVVPEKVEGGALSRDPSSISSGWGVVQWTPGSKVLLAAAKYHIGGEIYLLSTQLNIVLSEMKDVTPAGHHHFLDDFKKINDVDAATNFFMTNYEAAGISGPRTTYARQALSQFGGGASSLPAGGGCGSTATTPSTCDVSAPVYGSVNGVGPEYSQQQLTQIFGDPGTASSHPAMDKNLTSVDFLGHSVQANKKMASCLEAVAQQIKSENVHYTIKQIGCYRFDSNNGASNIGLRSYHTYGVACDINWDTNPFVESGAPTQHDMPDAYIKAFHDHGFTWGGNWHQPKDYMHFEFNGIKP